MPKKTISVKIKHPNPLFELWLTEWRNQAKENDSKTQYVYQKALASLRKYPLPLETGKDCKMLNGFGDKLCTMLDNKLREHNGNTKPPTKSPIQQKKKTKTVSKNKKNPTPDKEYLPRIGSGAYGILVTLYQKSLEENYIGYLTKSEIIRYGQHITDESFTKPLPNSRYTAWSSMATLISKQLVHKESNPAKFSLTIDGATTAKKLYDLKENENINIPRTIINSEQESAELVPSTSTTQTKSASTKEDLVFPPNSFDVLLYVDTQETIGSAGDVSDDPLLSALQHLKVNFEVKHLNVGDYVWICRHKENREELVLPFIVERKRMDDFAHSIKDGRYYEQKFRLKRSKIPSITYLIESHGSNLHAGLPLANLMQAATNTAIHDGFSVQFTDNIRDTAKYLAVMSHALETRFKSKTMFSTNKQDAPEKTQMNDDIHFLMLFSDFNRDSVKSKELSVRDLFIRMLLQIKGMSVDKAIRIVDEYPTPAVLFLAYECRSASEGERLLSELKTTNGKNVGQVLSKTVYLFFTKETL